MEGSKIINPTTSHVSVISTNPLVTLSKLVSECGGLQAIISADIVRHKKQDSFHVFVTYAKGNEL